MKIGDRIALRRKNLGLTQEELASKLGYKSKSSINKIELGITDISQSKIVSFANALETTPAYLMGWEDEEQKEQPTELGELSPIECDLVRSWRSSDATTRSIISKILDLDEKEPICSRDAV